MDDKQAIAAVRSMYSKVAKHFDKAVMVKDDLDNILDSVIDKVGTYLDSVDDRLHQMEAATNEAPQAKPARASGGMVKEPTREEMLSTIIAYGKSRGIDMSKTWEKPGYVDTLSYSYILNTYTLIKKAQSIRE